MHDTTRSFLDACNKATCICPHKLAGPYRAFLTAIRESVTEGMALRMEFVAMLGDEEDPQVRGRLEELDQKLGALEREARTAMDHAKKVQAIHREFVEARDRLRTEIEEAGEP